MTGLQHPECYARALGGCSQNINREHYVSESIIQLVEDRTGKVSKAVRVFGLAFLPQEQVKEIGVASLTARILCATHNRALSRFDNTGKEMFLAMDALNEAAGDVAAAPRTFRIAGDDLERWMLKVMFGGLYSGNFRVAPTGTMQGECPPVDLLKILFKGANFAHRQGLFWMPPVEGEMITADPHILRLAPLLAENEQTVCGFRVWFFGFEFVLLIAPITPGIPTRFDGAHYRPAGLNVIGSNVRIEFAWQEGAQCPLIEVQHHQS